jgi:hypothetical protein
MRFRQGPLLEASLIYVVASVVSFISLIAVFGFDFGSITGAFTVEAMILLLPSFVLWAIAGQFTKTKSIFVRFFVQVSINSVLAAIGIVLVGQLAASVTDPSVKPNMNIVYLVFASYYLGALAGSIFSNFWFVKRAQAAETAAAKAKKGGKK